MNRRVIEKSWHRLTRRIFFDLEKNCVNLCADKDQYVLLYKNVL